MNSANEIVCAGQDAIDSIKLAIKEICDNDEYNSITLGLKEIISDIEKIVEENEEKARKECEAENSYMNYEYERSVI